MSQIDAPRELVFDAWTNEEQLSKWWGPRAAVG
ncbi:SRPBCC domain-containing protein [Paenibacillus anseongensis]|nr:SRPBCC domain-containing protein [Paenibacillus sp. CGMCC 1.16610]